MFVFGSAENSNILLSGMYVEVLCNKTKFSKGNTYWLFHSNNLILLMDI